jgi:hypothetical protein
MSVHDHVCKTFAPDGQEVMIVEGPSEIASWFFPHEPEEDEQLIALRTASRICSANGSRRHSRNRPTRSPGNDVLFHCRRWKPQHRHRATHETIAGGS